MDGNGRWAREKGLPRREGHRAGAESVREVVEACKKLGVRFLTLYAFSSENWKRPKAEIRALMALLKEFLRVKTPEMKSQGVRLHAIGRLEDLPSDCQRELYSAIDQTSSNSDIDLVLALSYGSREEIVDAARQLASEAANGILNPEDIDNDLMGQKLYTKNIPDPDLLIRTSGERRLSNFLLWQISYAEIVISEKFWPDFREPDLKAAIAEYGERNRRFGSI
ncbi:MAG: di-trans,poly-cis-decaprenylcistransferase [Roseibacillus sp.]|jgi:undecaprenyl diphosphate synthase|nr:di-trans,poly-cis-decaprenylcistransferase [Roseibacillus sp.]|tara:strand:+ start:4350 stop:5018 length:669 start_codon:yes stop_codon:yes gene_type:complete